MKSVYGLLKPIYKRLVPRFIQRLTWDRRYPFHRWVEPLKSRLQRKATHDEIYDAYYFEETVEGPMRVSATVMAETLCEKFEPTSVIDIGCGPGLLISALRARGVSVKGVEYAEAALQKARDRGLEVVQYDLENDTGSIGEAGLVVSTEVAEHLPEQCADRFVDLLVATGPVVVMTAATPGQGGTDHVNEQPNAYWIEKFESRGSHYDEACTQDLRQSWQEQDVEDFYSKNVMVFRRIQDPASTSGSRLS